MDGLTGALTARAEAHSMRLALIYALLDGASSIKVEHLAGGARRVGLCRAEC